MSYSLSVQGFGITQGEWPAFFAFFVIWVFPFHAGWKWLRRLVFAPNDPCYNWMVTLWWMTMMGLMWISTFFFWRLAESESRYYQVGMWMYYLTALFAMPLPYFVAREWRTLSVIFSFFVLGASTTASAMGFQLNPFGPEAWLTIIFAGTMVFVFFMIMFTACGACCCGWPSLDEEPYMRRSSATKKRSKAAEETTKMHRDVETAQTSVSDADEEEQQEERASRTKRKTKSRK